MLLKFKQAVCLNGKPFAKGIQEADEATMAHPFFKKMFDCGLIVEPTKAELTAAAPQVPNNEKLKAAMNKIHGKVSAEQEAEAKAKAEAQAQADAEAKAKADAEAEAQGQSSEEPQDLEPQDQSHDQEPSSSGETGSDESHSKNKSKGKKK